MALEGTLRDFSLADIFQLIGLQRKTGVLSLKGPEDTVSVLFDQGRIVGAESEIRRLEDRLGNVLLKTGKVSRAELNQVLTQQRKTGRRIGDILVEGSILNDEDLGRALALQVTQIVYRLFRWSEGSFRFAQTSSVDYESNRFRPIPVEGILMEGLRILDEWPLIEKRVNSFEQIYRASDAQRLVRAMESGEDLICDEDLDLALDGMAGEETPEDDREETGSEPDVVTVSPLELTVYNLLDGTLSVQEVIDRSDMGEFETCKALFSLLEKDLIAEATLAVNAPKPVPKKRAYLDRGLTAAVALLGSAVLLGGAWNHLANTPPGRYLAPYSGSSPAVDTLRLGASHSRLARLEFAIRLFALYRSHYPRSLDELARMGLLTETDLQDPWGRPYDYILTRRSYQIRGADADGQQRPELILTGKVESFVDEADAFSRLENPTAP
jgi:hypothetical protein